MRLVGYALVELGLAGLLIFGLGFVGAQGLNRLVEHWARMERTSTTSGAAGMHRRNDLSNESAMPVPSTATDAPGTFLGMSDDLLLERLRTQAPKRLKLNRGGSSLSFRIDFADGSRAAWKPAQTNTQTVPRREVAAYRLNRLLGLSAVPPAAPRAFSKDDLFNLLHPESISSVPRIRAETIIGPNGMVSGEASYWIPVIKDSEFDNPQGQQQVTAWLTQGESIPFAQRSMAAQMSILAVFDFLIANPDRHSGSNMKTSADGSQLFFMDNTMAFFIEPESTEKNRVILLRTQRFSRRFHQALSRVDMSILRPLMRDADGSEVLTEPELRAVIQRREYVQRYVADLIKKFGESQVLYFP